MNDTIQDNSQKGLLITHEYGRRISGGVGRVVNGIFSNLPESFTLDIFLIKSPFSQGESISIQEYEENPDFIFAYVYRKEKGGKVKCLCSGKYRELLHLILNQEKYNLVQAMVFGDIVNWCMKTIKIHFPEIKFIYSCHSIAKHEIHVRHNSSSDLIEEDFMIHNADHIQVLNKSSLVYLKNVYPLEICEKKISIIPNGINESEFLLIDETYKAYLTKKINPAKDIIVVCLSRWSFGKGLEYLIDAVPLVIQKHKNVKFIIAGRKAYSWENEVEKYVQMIDRKISDLGKNIIVQGWLDNSKRNTLLSMSNIFVMPSLLEYFPYSILEPAVCKVPVISSHIDSVTDFLENGRECLFFQPENSIELAEKINYLIEDETKRKELSLNAYAKVKKSYSWAAISQQYINMYQTVVLNEIEKIDSSKR
jgi:glycosyltransferase involved in cell wall biosynthesis